MSSGLRVVVTGLIAQFPVGGVTWDYLQYVLGLAQLGHDVYYLEDSGQWPYNPMEIGGGQDCTYNARYLAETMSRFGFARRWMYRFPGGVLPGGRRLEPEWFGLSDTLRREVMQSADILINVSCGLGDLETYEKLPRLVYIDSDPVFTQLRLNAGKDLRFCELVDSHQQHFSFGECLSEAVPPTPYTWVPTRQPTVLSEWHPTEPLRQAFTTVMNWVSYKPLVYGNQSYGHKDRELQKFLDLPALVSPTVLELAISAGEARRLSDNFLTRKGWHIVKAAEISATMDSYRDYITSSLAEWSVAKNGYVVGRAGWFSCRSACYLATGRPVVVQNTGFAPAIPTGEGVLTFETIDEAVDAIRRVESDYPRHAKAARAIAEEYFDSAKVLTRLVEHATTSPV